MKRENNHGKNRNFHGYFYFPFQTFLSFMFSPISYFSVI